MNKTQRGPDSTTGQHTFHWSHVDLSVLQGRDGHSDMNELLQHKRRLPLDLNFSNSFNASAAFHTNTGKMYRAYLVDYALYQLCMKQLHIRALGPGWKGNILYESPLHSLSLSPCPFINPAGRAFVCANIRLAVCLTVSSVLIPPAFFYFSSLFVTSGS